MSDLIPSCTWADFKTIVDAGRVEELKSCEILLPEHRFNVVIFRGDTYTDSEAKAKSERTALRTNYQGAKDPQELLKEIEEEHCQSLNLSVKPVAVSRRRGNTRKSRKSSAHLVGVK